MQQTTTTSLVKSMVGIVVSDRMTKTVSVQVTTFKVHPLYHKRYRWTKKYLADSSEVQPQVGDTVRIVSHRPISKSKRWSVAAVVTPASAAQLTINKKAAQPKVVAVKPKRTKKA
jgi:small subunit ribosomal protein S17